MNKLKAFLASKKQEAGSTKGTLVAVVGGYIVYLGFQMLQDTKSGVSSMGMGQTIAFMVLLVLAGAIVFAYGAWLFWVGWKKEKEAMKESEEGEEKMVIQSVFDKEFAAYGHVIEGYNVKELLETLDRISPLPEGVEYIPGNETLEALPIAKQLSSNEYGGMPIQLGWCNGHNTKMNCLEYHRDSEVNLGTEDFILLLAKLDDVKEGRLDSSLVKAFLCPAGVPVEVFATTLHYAPCSAKKDKGFKVLVVLPLGTNGPKPDIEPLNDEDRMLRACNKWLLAHPDSDEAKDGAVVCIDGVNPDICDLID